MERLKILQSPSTWDEKLPELIFKLNSTPISSTSPSPFYYMHGYEPRSIVNNKLDIPTVRREGISDERVKAIINRWNNQRKVVNKRKKSAIEPKIKVGDVLNLKIIQKRKQLGKLNPNYSLNNFIVVKINQNSTSKIVDTSTGKERVENFTRLKRIRGRKPSNYNEIIEKYREKEKETAVFGPSVEKGADPSMNKQ